VTQSAGDHEDDGFGYETMYLLQAAEGGQLDVAGIRSHLQSIGESVLVAGDERAVKIHVHSERPDEVIAFGLGQGSLSRITVENLDNQTRDVRETRAAEFTGAEAPGDGAATADGGTSPGTPVAAPQALAVIAVAPGDGLAAIFRDLGVAAVVRGGQSANPSTGELLEAVQAVEARELLLLPNNPNVLMAARQVAAMADRPVVVVPTRNAAEGFAALLALDPDRPAAENAPLMTDAGRAVQTLAVTESVRDATIGGRRVRRGQTIVLDPDDGVVACDNDTAKAVLAGVAALQPGFELVTVYYGHGTELEDAEAMARRIGEAHDGIEVEVIHGGQPHYRYLIAAE
jgi:dihydroxyacetone kinase-like predicted kinase